MQHHSCDFAPVSTFRSRVEQAQIRAEVHLVVSGQYEIGGRGIGDIGIKRWLLTQEIIGEKAKFCWAREPQPVEIISRKANPNHQNLLRKIYEDSPARATSDRLIAVLDDVFQLLGQKSYSETDLLLRNLDPKKAAPEYFVGLLRVTSKEVRHLPSWPSLFASVKTALRGRKLNPEKILIGLS
jgi:hypothetical protein